MGLLTKEIEVTLNSRNIEHYANLGYEIPKYYNKNSCTWRVKRNTKIIVKIEDVPKFTNYLVDVQCDNENCANVLHMPYQRYNYHLKTVNIIVKNAQWLFIIVEKIILHGIPI